MIKGSGGKPLPNLRGTRIDAQNQVVSLSIKNQYSKFIKLRVGKAGLPPLFFFALLFL